jgi:predicted HAD superfamily Cof-like phosphohydrolase
MKTFVKLDFDVVGFHYYQGAPISVDFLKYNHRHIFNIKAEYEVTNLDREKEIFIQTDILTDYLYQTYGSPCQFEGMSCEMIAKELLEFGIVDGIVSVEVLEDNRGGARVEL